MATELIPNEGKDWIANNPIAGAAVHAFLLFGVTIDGTDVTATSLLSTVQATAEEDGTGYARIPITVGSSTDGIMALPEVEWDTGAEVDWATDVRMWGISTDATAGVALYYWDLSQAYNMASAGAVLTIPTLDIFFLNPGES